MGVYWRRSKRAHHPGIFPALIGKAAQPLHRTGVTVAEVLTSTPQVSRAAVNDKIDLHLVLVA